MQGAIARQLSVLTSDEQWASITASGTETHTLSIASGYRVWLLKVEVTFGAPAGPSDATVDVKIGGTTVIENATRVRDDTNNKLTIELPPGTYVKGGDGEDLTVDITAGTSNLGNTSVVVYYLNRAIP